MSRVLCDKCGARVEVPAGHARAKIRCTTCGYYAEVPPELRGREPEAEDAPPPPPARRRTSAPPPPDPADEPLRPGVARPTRKAVAGDDGDKPRRPPDDTGSAPPILEGTQDDDGRPYGVPSDGTKKCPECRGRIPYDATFCTRCGTDLETGKKPKKKFQVIDRSWEYRWPLKVRLAIFAGFQFVSVLLAGSMVAGGASPIVALFSLVLQAGLQSFLVGSYETLTVRRNAKGQATIATAWRYCFVKVLPWKVPWKDSHAVTISGTNDAGMFAWAMCIYLLLCTCVVPGLFFWWFFIRPERFDILLCDVHGGTNHVLFRCTTWDEAHEVMTVIKEATGLADQSQLGRRHLDAPAVDNPDAGRPGPRLRDRPDDEDDDE